MVYMIIKNGTIVNGSGGSQYRSDIAIEDGKIRDMDVFFDRVPTSQAVTTLFGFFPPYVVQGSKEQAPERLSEPRFWSYQYLPKLSSSKTICCRFAGSDSCKAFLGDVARVS